MEALKRRLSRAVSGDSATSAASAKSRPRRSALTSFQFRKANVSKSLASASSSGNAQRVRELLDGNSELPDTEATDRAVRVACEKGHLDVLATLIRYGAAINSLADGDSAPLHIAVRSGYVSLIMLLIGNGANVNILTRFERRSPLHVAAMKGRQEALKILLEADSRANPDVTDIYGTTPLHLATGLGHSAVVEVLLGWGRKADVNAYDNEGWTALHLAAERGDAVMTQLLLGHNAQVDCQNKYGRTPLHWATIRRHADVVELLLQHDASPTLKDLHDKCARDYADDPAVARLLRATPAPPGPPPSGHLRSTIGGFMKMAVRQSFISRLAAPIPRDGSWTEAIVALKHGGVGADLGAIAEESSGARSSGSGSDDDDDDDGGEDGAARVASLKSFFGKNGRSSLHKRASGASKYDADVDFDARSTSTIPLGGLFDREMSTDSNSSCADDVTPSSSATSRCQTPDGGHNNNDVDVDDKSGEPGDNRRIPEEARLAQAQFRTLMSKVERHQSAIETIVRSVSEEVQKAVTGKRHLSDDNLKSVARMVRRIDDLIFDFREDVDQQATLLRATIRAFLANIEPRLSARDPLPMGFYHGFFHSVVSYLADRPHGHMMLVQKMVGISEEKRSDMLQAMPNSPSAKAFSCGQAVYFALEHTPSCHKTKPLLALLSLVIKCDFEEDAAQKIIREFISITTPNFFGCLDQGKLFSLSHRLGGDGVALASQLGVSQLTGNGVISAPKHKSNFERNLEIFSRWRQVTASEASNDCVLKLVRGLILIGREDLLACILANQTQSSKVEESSC